MSEQDRLNYSTRLKNFARGFYSAGDHDGVRRRSVVAIDVPAGFALSILPDSLKYLPRFEYRDERERRDLLARHLKMVEEWIDANH